MKREVSKEELLRLARKAWPDDRIEDVDPALGRVEVKSYLDVMRIRHGNAAPAMHVALQQLAGELEPGSVTAVIFAYWLLTGRKLKHFEGARGWDVVETGPGPQSSTIPELAGFCLWLDAHAPEGLPNG